MHRVLAFGESDVLKIHFMLNKEALFRKIWKKVGIHQRHSGSFIPRARTFKEVWNSGALFVSGFRILEGLLTALGFLKSLPHLTLSQAVALVQGQK